MLNQKVQLVPGREPGKIRPRARAPRARGSLDLAVVFSDAMSCDTGKKSKTEKERTVFSPSGAPCARFLAMCAAPRCVASHRIKDILYGFSHSKWHRFIDFRSINRPTRYTFYFEHRRSITRKRGCQAALYIYTRYVIVGMWHRAHTRARVKYDIRQQYLLVFITRNSNICASTDVISRLWRSTRPK